MGELPYPQFSYMIYMIFIIYTSHHSLHTTTELAPDLLQARLNSSVEHRTGTTEVMGSNPIGASEL